MQLPLKNFSGLLQTMAAALQGAANALLDLSVGSTLRAIMEANAAISLWMQWLIVQVLGVTRAATSNGADLDSWMADFALARLPAATASGNVVLSRSTPTLSAFVPVGTQLRSSDGSQIFSVTSDPTNSAWQAIPPGYLIAAGIAAATVPVSASTPGAAGNIQSGTATVLGSAIAGVDAVTNPLAFAGGLDAEADGALRTRFATYLQSRASATALAVASAIDSVRVGLTYVISENINAGGANVPGSFIVTIDDGSGSTPAALLAQIGAAVDLVRPVGSVFAVRAPTILVATVSLSLGVSDEAARLAICAAVSAAITAYIEALPVGAMLAWSRLAQVAYAASPMVTNVTNLLLNGGSADLAVPAFGVAKAGSVVAS